MQNVSPSDALNSLYPLPCAFVLSIDQDKNPSGMIASWIMQTSFQPPLIAVSVGKSRYTFDLISQSGEFVISVPDKNLEKEVLVFGTKSGRDVSKFEVTNLKTMKSRHLATPLLKEASYNFECIVVKDIETGDHNVFVGEVLAAWRNKNKKVLMNMGHKADEWVFDEY